MFLVALWGGVIVPGPIFLPGGLSPWGGVSVRIIKTIGVLGYVIFLPPVNEVWDKVMFYSCLSVHGGLCMMSLPFWKLSPMFLPRGFLSGGQVRIGGLCQDGGSLSGSGGDICQEGGLCQERSPCAVDERAVCNDFPLCVMWIEKNNE